MSLVFSIFFFFSSLFSFSKSSLSSSVLCSTFLNCRWIRFTSWSFPFTNMFTIFIFKTEIGFLVKMLKTESSCCVEWSVVVVTTVTGANYR
ncbi:hypothetical protein BDC45DRAFT_493479 [Circinella umbellata]|nr:hypothetical protein BDC45DRAFT_493479 [Circinella umbellata]